MDVRQKTTELESDRVKTVGNDGASLGEGIAAEFTAVVTTNKEDRDHDILEPSGAELDPAMPLLWQHDPTQPIGKYTGTVERDSEKLVAKYQVADTPLGRDAAALLKLGVLRISHGFRPQEYEPRKGGSGGYHFKRYEMVETSLVSIPSNTDAQVLSLSAKSFETSAVRQFVKGLTMTTQTQTPPAENKAGTFTIDEIKSAVSEGVVAAFATIAKGNGEGNTEKGNGPTPADLLKAAGGGKPDVTVKSVAARYSTETRALKHFKSGDKVKDAFGNRPTNMSELNQAKAGAFLKKLAAKAGIPVVLGEEDQALLELCYGEKWCGEYGGQYQHDAIDGMRMKDLLSDSISGGTNAVPFWFDVDLISFPLLTGELYPYVDVRNVPRGNSVHAASVANPTVQWNVAEGTDIPMFDTSSFIAGIDSTIYPVTCAITVGRDFLSDSPADVGRQITENVGQRLANELDKVVAVGSGTTQPTGIFIASGTSSVNAANTTSGPPVVADYSGLLFAVAKQYRNAGNRCCFISNDTSYQRSRNIQVAQSLTPYSGGTPAIVNQLPIFGIDSFNAYSALGWPWRINNSISNNDIAFAAMAKYVVYRRLGFELQWITQGAELARRNEAMLVVRGRFGGQPVDANGFAVMTDAQN
jgi:HK97 family phage major capsid protein/HK97 family phage prohead protease